MTKFKLEQKVRVITPGRVYPDYKDFADSNGLTKYRTGMEGLSRGQEGVVVAVGVHSKKDSQVLVVARINDRDFIFGEDALERIQTPAEAAGLVVGKEYLVKKSDIAMLAEAVVRFVEDDSTNRPKFYFEGRGYVYPYVHEVSEISEVKENTVIEFDKVLTQEQIDAIKVLVA